MSKWFTPQERGVILFLIATLLVGIAVYIYKSKTPYFAPELKILVENPAASGVDNKWQNSEECEPIDTLRSNLLEQLIQETSDKLAQQTQPTQQIEKININTAQEQELIALPGIGPALAKRIIDYRERNNGFKTTDDIIKVWGIGKKKLQLIKDKITI
ncbi:MAG: ComEA family DNA-binding protein [Candidatus Stahlbacteria bacterium]|nr:ComEA family DNA-binding protein [Candidatus Stahlbacteria bacterium]